MPPNGARVAPAQVALLACLALVAACGAPSTTALPARPTALAAADPWQQLLDTAPYPYLFPVQQPIDRVLDGTYTKVEPSKGDDVHCLRCPDYALSGGVWKLNLAGGVFRIYHEDSGWKSLGSFVITHDRVSKVDYPDKLLLFNDPYCPDIVGIYTWAVMDEGLQFQIVDDTCSYQLRGANLTGRPWLSCEPPNYEAAITDHWPKPQGCD